MSTEQLQWNQHIVNEFRASGGDVATNGFGKSLVLVHHTGAKSGAQRVNPLRSVHDGNGTWWIVASAQGAPKNPDWFHNLRANPDSKIETPDDGTFNTMAEVLTGEEREYAWQQFTAANPIFLQYQEETERVFPILALHRQD